MQLHEEVRADVDVEGFGEMRHLQPRRDAADPGDVDLDDAGRAAVEVFAELRDGVHRLADGDRRRGGAGEAHVPFDVICRERLLDPAEVEPVEEARAADRLGRGHRLVGVDHEVEPGPDGVADGGEALAVLVAARLADLDLDAAQALALRDEGTLHEVVDRQVQPAALGVVERHITAEAAGEAPQRQSGALRRDIPQGGVDCGEGERGDRAGRGGAGRGEQAVPDRLDAIGLLADQQVEQVVAQHRQHRAPPCADRVGVAAAVQAVAGVQFDEDRLLLDEALHGVGALRFDGDIDEEGASIGDRGGHGLSDVRKIVFDLRPL